MQGYKYFTLDVFTDQAFGGNPLAVFTEAGALAGDQMQQIARELNLSETVFITGSYRDGRVPVRIFTPTCEIPFAGHPTVGTALLLEKLGWIEQDRTQFVLEEGVGDIEITLDATRRVARFKTARLPTVKDSCLTANSAANLLGLRREQLVADPVIGDCGLPFQLIELTDQAAVSEAQLDLALWRELLADDECCSVYIYSRAGEQGDIRARMFDPGFNIPEDPATGSAAAALVGALAIRDGIDAGRALLIEQGVEMGRPSLIHTVVDADETGVKSVCISGEAVLMSEGRFFIQ